MPISVNQSGAACGAEIDFDLAGDLDDATFREIETAFHDSIVVVFRAQQLSNEQQIEFSRRFGEPEIHIVKKYLLPGYPEILLISNIRDAQGEHIGLAHAGFTWHSDTSYRLRPSRCSLLYAKEVPQRDGQALGDTVFANAIAAYQALPKTTTMPACRAQSDPPLLGTPPRRRQPAAKANPRTARRDAGRRASHRPHPPLHRPEIAVCHGRRVYRHRGDADRRSGRSDCRTRCSLHQAGVLLSPQMAGETC